MKITKRMYGDDIAFPNNNSTGTMSYDYTSKYSNYKDIIYVKLLKAESSYFKDNNFYFFYKNLKDDELKNLIVKCHYQYKNEYIFEFCHYNMYSFVFDSFIMRNNIKKNAFNELLLIKKITYESILMFKKLLDNNIYFYDNTSGNTLLNEKLDTKIIDYGSFVKITDETEKIIKSIKDNFDTKKKEYNIWKEFEMEMSSESIDNFLLSYRQEFDDIKKNLKPEKIIHNYNNELFKHNVNILSDVKLIRHVDRKKYVKALKNTDIVDVVMCCIDTDKDIKTSMQENTANDFSDCDFELGLICRDFLTNHKTNYETYLSFEETYFELNAIRNKTFDIYICIKTVLNIIDAYKFYTFDLKEKIKIKLDHFFIYGNMFNLKNIFYRNAFVLYNYDNKGDDNFFDLLKKTNEFIKTKNNVNNNINVILLINFLNEIIVKHSSKHFNEYDAVIKNAIVNEIILYCENIEKMIKETHTIIAIIKLFNTNIENKNKFDSLIGKNMKLTYNDVMGLENIMQTEKTVNIVEIHNTLLHYKQIMEDINPEKYMSKETNIMKIKYKKYKAKYLKLLSLKNNQYQPNKN